MRDDKKLNDLVEKLVQEKKITYRQALLEASKQLNQEAERKEFVAKKIQLQKKKTDGKPISEGEYREFISNTITESFHSEEEQKIIERTEEIVKKFGISYGKATAMAINEARASYNKLAK